MTTSIKEPTEVGSIVESIVEDGDGDLWFLHADGRWRRSSGADGYLGLTFEEIKVFSSIKRVVQNGTKDQTSTDERLTKTQIQLDAFYIDGMITSEVYAALSSVIGLKPPQKTLVLTLEVKVEADELGEGIDIIPAAKDVLFSRGVPHEIVANVIDAVLETN